MKIARVSIENYKSFRKLEPVELSPGFNVVVGANNSGKTAFLEAVAFSATSRPHRSLTTSKSPGAALNPNCRVTFDVRAEGKDVERAMIASNAPIGVPFPAEMGPSEGNSKKMLELLKNSNDIRFTFEVLDSALGNVGPIRHPVQGTTLDQSVPYFVRSADGNLQCTGSFNNQRRLEWLLRDTLRTDVYGFKAERLNIGQHPFGPSTQLARDASNLPEVLHVLQSASRSAFDRFVDSASRVFPSIQDIRIVPAANQKVEIQVWEHARKSERPDLAISLIEGGTGIGQVLAMLYVLVTAQTGRVFVIDELNSFLHPGAVRALLDIFVEHPQHQYILSTHSPQVVSQLADRAKVFVFSKNAEGATEIRPLDSGVASSAKSVLESVGARLSDVFGADGVLWVEGPTEERCFELIRRKYELAPQSGLLIRGVVNTGDFDDKTRQTTLEVYQRLSAASFLVPPAVGFLFDREKLGDDDIAEIQKESKGAMQFIPARMIECFFLDPEAIAARLGQRGLTEVTTQKVAEALKAKLESEAFRGKPGAPADVHKVDAAKVLKEVFNELSETEYAYQKTQDGPALCAWLLEKRAEALKPLVDALDKQLSPKKPNPVS